MLAYFTKFGDLILVPENNAEYCLADAENYSVYVENEDQKKEREGEAELWLAPDYGTGVRWGDQTFPSKIGEVTCKTNMETP